MMNYQKNHSPRKRLSNFSDYAENEFAKKN